MTDPTYGMDKWRGRVALVTGASSGIGLAAARALAGHGMKVAITARRRDRLDVLEKELTAAGAEVLNLPADFMRESEVLGVFEAIRDAWGGTDVLINNAGLGHKRSIAEGDLDEWREEVEINLVAASICLREAVRDMERRGAGQVITISSIAGLRVPLGKDVTMYSAAKHAIRAVTTGLWGELAQRGSPIKVGVICPGSTETEWHAQTFKSEEIARKLFDRIPPLSAEDIVEAIRYMMAAPANVQINEVVLRPVGQKE